MLEGARWGFLRKIAFLYRLQLDRARQLRCLKGDQIVQARFMFGWMIRKIAPWSTSFV